MELTKKEQEKFNQASEQIFRYHDLAYGRIALAKFMEAIEEYPQLPLKDIYDLLYEEDEDEEHIDLSLEENAEWDNSEVMEEED